MSTPLTDRETISTIITQLLADGWAGGPDYACCMSCAKYELIPIHEAGTSCIWFTESDSNELRDGMILASRCFQVSVLGDIHAVADVFRENFGTRVGRIQPMTDETIGFLDIFAQGVDEHQYLEAFFNPPTTHR
jgi:hypothetical protein